MNFLVAVARVLIGVFAAALKDICTSIVDSEGISRKSRIPGVVDSDHYGSTSALHSALIKLVWAASSQDLTRMCPPVGMEVEEVASQVFLHL